MTMQETTATHRSLWPHYLVCCAILLAFWGAPVLMRVRSHCFHNFDLGIYAQAAHRLSLSEPNPRLSAFQRRIFTDHFDPILFVAAPAAKIFRPDYVCVVLELLVVLACPLPVLWLYRKGKLGFTAALLLVALLLFNRGILRALSFPVHPTTWAVLPLALLAAYLVTERPAGILTALTLLFACREEFPFAGIMLGIWFVCTRKRRFGLLIIAWSAVWVLFAFWIRPMLMGPVTGFGPGLIERVWSDPMSIVKPYVADFSLIRRILELVAVLTPMGVWMARSKRRPHWGILLMLVPMLSIRFLGHAWYFHYLSPVMAAAALATLPAMEGAALPRWVVASTLIMLAGFNGGGVVAAVRAYSGTEQPCQSSRERLEAIRFGVKTLLEQVEGPALVQGNLMPCLVERPRLFQVGGLQRPGKRIYRYVFVEKPPSGVPYPLSHERYEWLIAHWRRTKGVKILRDDAAVFLARGRFRIDR